MMALAIAVIVIVFIVAQDAIVFWVTVGTVLLSFIVMCILVPKSNSNKARRYSKRSRSTKGSAFVSFASGVKQAHRRSERARTLRNRNSGVRSSLIGLHRR